MTELALRAPAAPSLIGSALSWLWSACAGTAHAVLATLRLGAKTWLAAPLLVAIVAVPELLQHIAEISLGLFESKDAWQAGAGHPLRWFFAYPKSIGFAVAILATARFWALGSVRAALLVRPATILRILFAVALSVAAALPFDWLKTLGGPAAVDGALTAVSMAVQGGFLVYIVAAALDDRSVSLRTAFTRRWPTAALAILLAALAFQPMQELHNAHHYAAMGQPAPLVWGLMIWDTAWVGLMATLLGSALFVAHRSGPTWCKWTVDPRTIG